MTKISKGAFSFIENQYNHPRTSLLYFHFAPCLLENFRWDRAIGSSFCIDGKQLYLIDGFFDAAESEEMRDFSLASTYSRNSYGSQESIQKGEKPARTSNSKEAWQLFSHPPSALKKLYRFFGFLAATLEADVTTLPWELCTEGNISPSVLANYLESASENSMVLGKHQDCNPSEKISFGIPVLYDFVQAHHGGQFENGSTGNPWLVTAMLYVTDKAFQEEYKLGTVFYNNEGNCLATAACRHMRIVLFEGDIWHSIEKSNIPSGLKTWRVSYVFKLVLNPKKKEDCLKQNFLHLWNSVFTGS